MGFGLPAAIGAQVAYPDAIVVDIAGDSSIQMNIQEMATAVQSSLPVKIVILNNGYMGMVRQWQELFYGKRYVSTCMDCAPDFVKLAEGPQSPRRLSRYWPKVLTFRNRSSWILSLKRKKGYTPWCRPVPL